MKVINYIFFIILIASVISFSQEKQTTNPAKEPGIDKQSQMNPDSTSQVFIDKNGDGINDLKENKMMKRRRGRMDNFIDKDGDGINDNRCEGLGWSKGKGRGQRSGRHSGKR